MSRLLVHTNITL